MIQSCALFALFAFSSVDRASSASDPVISVSTPTSDVSEPPSKRRKLSLTERTIDVHIDAFGHLDDFENIKKLEEELSATKDLVIGSGLVGGSVVSYYSDIDTAVLFGMTFVDMMLKPQTQTLTDVMRNFDCFMEQVAALYRGSNPSLHAPIITAAFDDLQKRTKKMVEFKGINAADRLRYTFCIATLRENVLGSKRTSMVELTEQNGSAESVQWTMFGFWRSFLRRTLKLQMRGSVHSYRRQKMLETLKAIWMRMRSNCARAMFPIAQKVRESSIKLLGTHKRTQRFIIAENIVNLVKQHRSATVAVILDHMPSCNLIQDLKEYGEVTEQSTI